MGQYVGLSVGAMVGPKYVQYWYLHFSIRHTYDFLAHYVVICKITNHKDKDKKHDMLSVGDKVGSVVSAYEGILCISQK